MTVGRHLTGLGTGILLLGAVLTVAALVLGDPVLGLGATLAGAALVVDAVWTTPLANLEGRRSGLHRNVVEGTEVRGPLTVDLGTRWPRLVSLRDPLVPPDADVRPGRTSTPTLTRRLSTQKTFQTVAPGLHQLGPARIALHGPLGLLERRQPVPGTRAEIQVVPAPAAETQRSTGDRRRPTPRSTAGQRPEGEDDFHRLRRYQPSDRLRDVNWKASQRALARGPDAEPIVTVRTKPSNQPLVVLLDARAVTALGPPGETPFARGLRSAARLLGRELDLRRPAGLSVLGDGTETVDPAAGRRHRQLLEETLAAQRPRGTTTLEDAIPALLDELPTARVVYVGAVIHDPTLPEALSRLGDEGHELTVHALSLAEHDSVSSPALDVLERQRSRGCQRLEDADLEVVV